MSRGCKPGVLERDWLAHRNVCARCRLVDLERTATLREACHTGAPLLKLALTVIARRAEKAEVPR